MNAPMTELESQVLSLLVAGDHPDLALLRQQAAHAVVVTRKYTGVGFFTKLAVDPVQPSADNLGTRNIHDVYAQLTGLDHEAGFILWIERGVIDCLESWIVDSAWPAAPQLVRAYYARPAPRRPGGGDIVFSDTRDLAWALRDPRAA